MNSNDNPKKNETWTQRKGSKSMKRLWVLIRYQDVISLVFDTYKQILSPEKALSRLAAVETWYFTQME